MRSFCSSGQVCCASQTLTMNNVVAGGSEFSSGCESGWTVYLEKSWLSPNCSISYEINNQGEEGAGVGSEQMRIKGGEEEEEDMSMVSDASSGPPHFNNIIDYSGFNNNHHGCFNRPTGGEAADEISVVDGSAAFGRRKKRNNDVKKQRMLLDDTASSRPVSHHLKRSETGFGHRIKNQSQVESHSMLDLSHGFSTTHIQDGPPAMDFFGHHQYQQTQFLGGNWMGFK